MLAGLGVFVRNQLAPMGRCRRTRPQRPQLLIMPAYPFWSLSLFAVDILAIYGLVAYDERIGTA